MVAIGPWWLGTGVAAAAVAVGSWLVLAGLSVAGWSLGGHASFWDAVGVSGQLWLLIHASSAHLGPIEVDLPPLGLTLALMLALAAVAAGGVKSRPLTTQPWKPVRESVMVVVTGYCLAAFGLAFAVGIKAQILDVGMSAFLFATVSAGAGALAVSDVVHDSRWPVWVLMIPRSILIGNLVLMAAGATGVGLMMVRHAGQMGALEVALNPGPGGGALLAVAQAFYLPTFALWAASFMLGTDVGLGDGSILSLTDTHVGIVPGIPIFGAVPGGSSGLWPLAWLLVGVLAGVAAAYSHGYRRRHAPIEQQMLTGGLVGLGTAVVFVVMAGLSRGDLGVARMSHLGPALIPLAIMSCALLGLSGMATGLVLGILARR